MPNEDTRPAPSSATLTGAQMHEAHKCLHECTPDQRDGWKARAYSEQLIGRQLREGGRPREDCDGIDQEHGWGDS